MRKILFSLLCATSISAFADVGDVNFPVPDFLSKYKTYTLQSEKKEVTIKYKQLKKIENPNNTGYISQIVLCNQDQCKSFDYKSTDNIVRAYGTSAAKFDATASNINISGTICSTTSRWCEHGINLSLKDTPEYAPIENTYFKLNLQQ